MVNPKNSCAGGYGKCLDVKITNACNGSCDFCIERNGYSPEETDVKTLALQTIKSDADNVLILGGEPTLYPHLTTYLQLIRPWKQKIYLTTNGSQFGGSSKLAQYIAPFLDGINISIHHYAEFLNDAVYKTCHICFEELKNAISTFHKAGVSVRFNTTLVRGMLDTKQDIDRMVEFSKYMGADEIRFSELQNCENLWVDARELFDNLPINPYEAGCEQVIDKYKDILVRVKMTCGRVNRLKPIITETPVCTNSQTCVLYPNGETKNGWYTNEIQPTKPGCHGCNGCH